MLTQKATFGAENICAGAMIDAPNVPCMEDMLEDSANVTEDVAASGIGPQAGANVTAGYKGSMEVGQTYEIHWPHSAAGACGTPNQYQTPFYDGVFCNLPLDVFTTLGPQDIASNVGVQAQVFTIVN